MRDVALVTGTRKGIGRHLIDHFLHKGYAVAGCSRDAFEVRCLRVIATIRRCRRRACCRRHGARRPKQLRRHHGARQQRWHRVNESFVADAAVHRRAHFLDQRLRNLLGHARGGQGHVGGPLRTDRDFATVATPLNLEGEATYAASKAAVESLTRIAARELAPFNITVNAVGPTPVMTDLVRSVPKRKLDALIRKQAIQRFGEQREVTNVIDFLVSRDSDFVTGQTIYLGGVTLGRPMARLVRLLEGLGSRGDLSCFTVMVGGTAMPTSPLVSPSGAST